MSGRIVIASGAAELVGDVRGVGPPVVCLHAGVADRRVWAPVAGDLAAGHRVYAYDRRGFGETVCTPESFSHVTDLGVVIESIEAQNAHYVALAGVAHLPMLEDPDSLGAVVRTFLDSL